MSDRTRGMMASLLTVLFMAAACSPAADGGIGGIGNNHNVIGTAALWKALGEELADFENTPEVTDEELARIYAAIRQRALQGELEPALAVLMLAQVQRRPAKPVD